LIKGNKNQKDHITDCPLKPYVSWSTKRVVVQPLRLPSDKELAQLE
jgi:hypothetical protein